MKKALQYIHPGLKVLIVLSSGLGVLLYIIQDDWSLNPLAYFTNQSNLLVFMVYLFLLFNSKSKNGLFTIILYQTVLAIVITGLVYHFILSPTFEGSSDLNPIPNILVHSLTPLLVVVERLIFGDKHILNRWHPIYFLTFPLVYYIFTLVYASFGGLFGIGTEYESKYPYFFLNIKAYGVLYFILVIVLFVLIGYLMVFINHHPLKKEEHHSN